MNAKANQQQQGQQQQQQGEDNMSAQPQQPQQPAAPANEPGFFSRMWDGITSPFGKGVATGVVVGTAVGAGGMYAYQKHAAKQDAAAASGMHE